MRSIYFYLVSFILFEASAQNTRKDIDSLNYYAYKERSTQVENVALNARIALKESIRIDYAFGKNLAHLNLGILAYLNKSNDSSFFHLKKAEQYFKQTDSLEYYAEALFYTGKIYDRIRDLKRAEHFFKKAYHVNVESGSMENQARCLNYLGIIQGKQANLSAALDHFICAYTLRIASETSPAHEFNNIAIVYRKMKRFEKGLAFARRAEQLHLADRDTSSIAGVYDVIGDILYDAGQVDSAMWYYQQSYDLGSRIGDSQIMFGAAYEMATVNHVDYGNSVDAIETYRNLLKEKYLEENVREITHTELARIFFSQALYDSAIFHGQLSLAETVKHKDRLQTLKVGHILKESYVQKNDFQNAHYISNLLHLQRDTLEQENEAAQLSDLRIQLETLDQEKQIELLEKQAKIDSLTNTRLIIFFVAIALVLTLLVALLIFRQRILILEKATLKKEVEKSNDELQQQALHMMHINNALGDVERELKNINSREKPTETRKILQKINLNKALEKDWENFKTYFGNVHKDFYNKLYMINEDLTQHEGRICALIKMNMNNREIATILNIQSQSAKMAKYRIKKKLNLNEECDLGHFLQKL